MGLPATPAFEPPADAPVPTDEQIEDILKAMLSCLLVTSTDNGDPIEHKTFIPVMQLKSYHRSLKKKLKSLTNQNQNLRRKLAQAPRGWRDVEGDPPPFGERVLVQYDGHWAKGISIAHLTPKKGWRGIPEETRAVKWAELPEDGV